MATKKNIADKTVPATPVNAAKKVAKKVAPRKPAVKRLDSITGHDQRNGVVSMIPTVKGKVNGYTVSNERTGYSAFEATREQALKLYDKQINTSHRQ